MNNKEFFYKKYSCKQKVRKKGMYHTTSESFVVEWDLSTTILYCDAGSNNTIFDTYLTILT